jgi:hypothetical protein
VATDETTSRIPTPQEIDAVIQVFTRTFALLKPGQPVDEALTADEQVAFVVEAGLTAERFAEVHAWIQRADTNSLEQLRDRATPIYNFTRAEQTELRALVDGLPDSRKALLDWLNERYAGWKDLNDSAEQRAALRRLMIDGTVLRAYMEAGRSVNCLVYEESISPHIDAVGWMISSIEDEAYPIPMDSVREALAMLTHDS